MRKRIFIAINLPDDLKREISKEQEEINNSFDMLETNPLKMVGRDKLHITLSFLGGVDATELPSIIEAVEKTAGEIECFSLAFNKIHYAPLGKKNPRMIWLTGEKSLALTKLQLSLEGNLSGMPVKEDKRMFSPHITLARIRMWELKNIDLEERPVVDKDVSWNFDVGSIDIMESQLSRKGPQYSILESIALQ